jgi:hypothetical protein
MKVADDVPEIVTVDAGVKTKKSAAAKVVPGFGKFGGTVRYVLTLAVVVALTVPSVIVPPPLLSVGSVMVDPDASVTVPLADDVDGAAVFVATAVGFTDGSGVGDAADEETA